ncbi:hypothetical protein T05_9165 [Trichinella murrelli]|uniref:Uncharacterized protein n=1 Tax=Trichinella murrelli TaxID=144512 RepID=A0A0V0T5U8_9BILA|nr:hypothetical protein T05_9165 [Trichinella murrelli]
MSIRVLGLGAHCIVKLENFSNSTIMEWFDSKFFPLPLKWKLQAALYFQEFGLPFIVVPIHRIGFKNDNQSSCRNLQNDSAEQEQPLRDCPSQRFNKPDSYHNLFIVSWITRVIYKYLLKRNRNRLARGFKSQTEKSYGN